MPTTCGLLSGAAFLYFAWSLLRRVYEAIYPFWIAKNLQHTHNLRKFGEWAVITGATDGIGEAYAHEVAKRFMKVYLISRSEEKLQRVAEDIRTQCMTSVRTLQVDFTDSSAENYEKIERELMSLDIGVLYNNVGLGQEYPEYYHEYSAGEGGAKKIRDMINVNLLATTMVFIVSLGLMTKICLPGMINRKRGVIVNMASGSGVQPYPYFNLYAATKVSLIMTKDVTEPETGVRCFWNVWVVTFWVVIAKKPVVPICSNIPIGGFLFSLLDGCSTAVVCFTEHLQQEYGHMPNIHIQEIVMWFIPNILLRRFAEHQAFTEIKNRYKAEGKDLDLVMRPSF